MPTGIYRVIGKMKTGDLRQRLDFQTKAPDIDKTGGRGPGKYKSHYQCWGYMASWNQEEKWKGSQLSVELTHIMVIRYDPQVIIDEKMYVFIQNSQGIFEGTVPGRRMRVMTVENYEERNIWLLVACKEIKPFEDDF
jgi:SPP1 family predicted phage head-tail adaptor